MRVISVIVLFFMIKIVSAADADSTTERRKSFKEVVNFILNCSSGKREIDLEVLAGAEGKPANFTSYSAGILCALANLGEIEEKRPVMFTMDPRPKWIFNPEDLLAKKDGLGLTDTEISTYRAFWVDTVSKSGMEATVFLNYVIATRYFEAWHTKERLRAAGRPCPSGVTTTSTYPAFYHSDDWLASLESSIIIP